MAGLEEDYEEATEIAAEIAEEKAEAKHTRKSWTLFHTHQPASRTDRWSSAWTPCWKAGVAQTLAE